MAYFKDGTTYSFLKGMTTAMVNIGWLVKGHPFPTGPTSAEFRTKLLQVSRSKRANQTRGIHFCEDCENFQVQYRLGVGESVEELLKKWHDQHGHAPPPWGSAEVHVAGKNGMIYAAPEMLAHYVIVHDYRPPEEFIQAIMAQPESTHS